VGKIPKISKLQQNPTTQNYSTKEVPEEIVPAAAAVSERVKSRFT